MKNEVALCLQRARCVGFSLDSAETEAIAEHPLNPGGFSGTGRLVWEPCVWDCWNWGSVVAGTFN